MTSPIKKRINTSYLLITTGGFIYRREIKKRIKKITDLLEEAKTEMTGKVKRL